MFNGLTASENVFDGAPALAKMESIARYDQLQPGQWPTWSTSRSQADNEHTELELGFDQSRLSDGTRTVLGKRLRDPEYEAGSFQEQAAAQLPVPPTLPGRTNIPEARSAMFQHAQGKVHVAHNFETLSDANRVVPQPGIPSDSNQACALAPSNDPEGMKNSPAELRKSTNSVVDYRPLVAKITVTARKIPGTGNHGGYSGLGGGESEPRHAGHIQGSAYSGLGTPTASSTSLSVDVAGTAETDWTAAAAQVSSRLFLPLSTTHGSGTVYDPTGHLESSVPAHHRFLDDDHSDSSEEAESIAHTDEDSPAESTIKVITDATDATPLNSGPAQSDLSARDVAVLPASALPENLKIVLKDWYTANGNTLPPFTTTPNPTTTSIARLKKGFTWALKNGAVVEPALFDIGQQNHGRKYPRRFLIIQGSGLPGKSSILSLIDPNFVF